MEGEAEGAVLGSAQGLVHSGLTRGPGRHLGRERLCLLRVDSSPWAILVIFYPPHKRGVFSG